MNPKDDVLTAYERKEAYWHEYANADWTSRYQLSKGRRSTRFIDGKWIGITVKSELLFKEVDEVTFIVGDIVYEMRAGWSGVPLEILEVQTNPGAIMPHHFIVKGARGWNVNGLLNEKHGAYTKRLHKSQITYEADSAV